MFKLVFMIHIYEAAFVISNTDYKKCPEHALPEFAFIGRSNVGKSSLINCICNKKKLAKTSATPGKTQLINHFLIQSKNLKGVKKSWYITDLPGYGYAKVAQTKRNSWGKMIEDYLTKRTQLTHTFVLIDSRLPPQQIDLEFLSYLDDWKIPFSIIFTKMDKLKPQVLDKNIESFFTILKEKWQYLPAYFVTSAEKKWGYEELMHFVNKKIYFN